MRRCKRFELIMQDEYGKPPEKKKVEIPKTRRIPGVWRGVGPKPPGMRRIAPGRWVSNG